MLDDDEKASFIAFTKLRFLLPQHLASLFHFAVAIVSHLVFSLSNLNFLFVLKPSTTLLETSRDGQDQRLDFSLFSIKFTCRLRPCSDDTFRCTSAWKSKSKCGLSK